MTEAAYNLFLYVQGGIVKQLGIATHLLEGTDQEKVAALQVLVNEDYKTAKKMNVKEGFDYRQYEEMMRLGRQLQMFEPLFRECNAPINPLVVITPIEDEHPRILALTKLGALN